MWQIWLIQTARSPLLAESVFSQQKVLQCKHGHVIVIRHSSKKCELILKKHSSVFQKRPRLKRRVTSNWFLCEETTSLVLGSFAWQEKFSWSGRAAVANFNKVTEQKQHFSNCIFLPRIIPTQKTKANQTKSKCLYLSLLMGPIKWYRENSPSPRWDQLCVRRQREAFLSGMMGTKSTPSRYLLCFICVCTRGLVLMKDGWLSRRWCLTAAGQLSLPPITYL